MIDRASNRHTLVAGFAAALLSSTAPHAVLAAGPDGAAAPSAPEGSQISQADQASQSIDHESNGRAIEEIIVIGKGMAMDLAPIKSSLAATQPVSIITRDYIDRAMPQTADFNTLAQIAPSASGYTGNGPGFQEAKTVIRGFQDGEYNITYDGIAFGDTNGPTHHSTSFFPSSTVGAVAVDRGPGNAGQLGQANFGGSINLFSPDMGDHLTGSQTATVGTWNSTNFVTTVRTGPVEDLGGTAVLVNLQELNTNGYLTFAGNKADNQLLKIQTPIGDKVKITFFGTHNTIRYYQADSNGATLSQVAQFGKNFALSNNPASQTYYGYNITKKETDFEYIRLQADITDGFYVDNTGYTYFYKNDTLSALDVTGATPNGTKAVGAPAGNQDIPGYSKNNEYRVYGDIFRAGYKFSFGELRAGVLDERSSTKRYRYDYDFTLAPPGTPTANLVPDPREKTAPFNILYLQYSGWQQYQPFADFVWTPIEDLTITPGVKYVSFNLFTNSPVQQTSRVAASGSHTFAKTLEFATVNYKIRDEWSVYGQFATGFLVPNIGVYQAVNPNLTGLTPQTSTNYQLGTVFNADRFTFDGDVYYIDFNNKQTSSTLNGETVFTNLGGAVYKGIEGQGTYAFHEGFALFANGSVNDAYVKGTSQQIAKAPRWTAAGGVLFNRDGWGASLIDKVTGTQWALAGEPAAYKIKTYNQADFTVTYDVTEHLKFEFGAYNLFDSQAVTAITQSSKAAAFDQYFFQAGRNIQFTTKITL